MRKFLLILFIFILVGFDLIIKYLIENLYDIKIYTPFFGEYLGLKLSYNTGIAFSLPIRGVFLQILTILIFFILSFYYLKEEYPKNSRMIDIGYVFIFSGALSHAYERIFVGHVIDFIAVKYFAIFNFADIFISVGAIILVLVYGSKKRFGR